MANDKFSEIWEVKDALQESVQSLHSAMEAIGVYYFEYYPDGEYSLQFSGRGDFGLAEKEINYPECWFEKKITHPEDESILRNAFCELKDGKEKKNCMIRNLVGGEYRYHQYKFTSIYNEDGKRKKIICTAQDVTDRIRSEEELLENAAMYRLTSEYTNVTFWTYDIKNDVMYNTVGASKHHFGEKVVKNFKESILSSNAIHPNSRKKFIELHKKLCEGQDNVSCDLWFRKMNGVGWWCERVNYMIVLDTDGEPIKAFGIGTDITELKNAEKRIKEEQQAQEGLDSERVVLKTRANITKNQVEYVELKSGMIDYGDIRKFTDGVENLIKNAFMPNDEDVLRDMLSLARITQAGLENNHYHFEYRRRDVKGHVQWLQGRVRAFTDPETNDVIAFVNLYDIHEEKNMNNIINRITEIDYEVLALIYINTNEIEPIRSFRDDDFMGMDFELPFDQAAEHFIDRYFIDNSKDAAKKIFNVKNIQKRLEENGTYEVSFTLKKDKIHQKKWAFTYFDETKTSIIYSRADVTELFKEQENQKQVLQDALLLAEQASYAKTNFLSRMSHEIRTPMNAIIGMNTLAMQAVDRPEEIRDCLSKIGISARFLLSLINDILDMSRIESGKVSLHNKKFALDDMINSINTIFYEQAEKKGIDYDCIIVNLVSDYYVGDSMKLQQILVNLLGNSIKFTERGGKIQLIVRQEGVTNEKAYLAFSVNDTGIGISDELQKRMFEPFEQGDITTTTQYKGTGLGLAIAKNLISMMDGTIQVHSIEGIGTEFVVRIPLELSDECKETRKLILDMPIEKFKTLIVDDDVTICEHTMMLLADMGMSAEWVDSGMQAVELIKKKWIKKDFFDVVLLDWKMPDMDGIETAKEIRKIVGDDVTIIIMTAYDWAEIELQAKKAGVNLLVTKPLFKSSIISAFEAAFSHKEKLAKTVEDISYDFSGKNILLVEDHVLNVEIAKRLLENKNAKVYVAENGLRAIEMFSEQIDEFYDVILMDIRMPVMDGLTATKSIRQLHKPYAKTVPIIAMSANAFEEDVAKSREVGMNEHLSKPIEADVLYASLQKWIF